VIETIIGNVDTKTAKDLETRLDRLVTEGVRDLTLDFAGVPFIASSGLRVILKVGKTLKGLGGSLKIVGPNSTVREVFRISGFDMLFHIE